MYQKIADDKNSEDDVDDTEDEETEDCSDLVSKNWRGVCRLFIILFIIMLILYLRK